MRIALVQVASPADEQVTARRGRVGEMVRQCRGADLVVLPELWPQGFFSFGSYAERAEPLDGDTLAAAREWVVQLGCHLHLGSFVERAPDGRLHNTAVLLGPDGQVLHTYRKIHVFGYKSREAELLTPGEDAVAAGTPFGQVAATTCYDLRFPELYRHLVDAGARIVIVPAAWPAVRLAHWRLFTGVRAVENQVFVIACNATGEQHGVSVGGHSRVVDPWGEVVTEAGGEEGVTYCDADPGAVDAVRTEFPVLADRRLQFPG